MNPLLDRRLAAHLSVRALAKKSGVSPTTISALERGEQTAYPLTVKKIADALGCAYDDLAALALKAGAGAQAGRTTEGGEEYDKAQG